MPSSQAARKPRPAQPRRDYDDRAQPRRQRRSWPLLLLGCLGGIALLLIVGAIAVFLIVRNVTGGNITGIPGLVNQSTYTQPGQVQLAPMPVSRVQVNDQVGVVTVNVDPKASSPSLTYVKRVKAGSSSAANTDFGKMSVQAIPQGSSLAITATMPSTGGFSHNDAVDLTLTLPQSELPGPTATPPFALTVNVSIGDIKANGISGVLNLQDQVGNVSAAQTMLDDGSRLSTSTGDVTFTGVISTTPAAGNTSPHIKLQSEEGNVTVTLPSGTNVILDANTNLGKITSAFPITITTSNGAANYYGPLLPNSNPQMILTLDVSTGNVTLHQG